MSDAIRADELERTSRLSQQNKYSIWFISQQMVSTLPVTMRKGDENPVVSVEMLYRTGIPGAIPGVLRDYDINTVFLSDHTFQLLFVRAKGPTNYLCQIPCAEF
ncbi:hypothetical protein T265_06879 [Opisthorchis viverrini]|uniref:Uncharacterized protein n=1 Tax=Opisthorchis viverrini TaxID=6198 RepID=A0A074ZEL2_OPIVI|nr:hypothetical protein T265_06879 [Opisthorchis viverrini]KER25706.1 hypothetical protein T265_06879 [Opisthorchis viverrini]